MLRKIIATLLCTITLCYGEATIINTFNGGELSPHMNARIDFQKYQSGLRTMENFVCLPYGGAMKRQGTQYIAETKSNGVARLAPFSVGVDQSYVLEMGAGYVRFYQDGIQITTSGVPLEVSTPYTTNDLFQIQLAQFADIMYMVHPNHPPQKLERVSTAPTFTMSEVDFIWPALLDENPTDITITPSAVTGSVTLISSDALFTSNHVGSTWVLNSPNTNNVISLATTASGTSTAMRVEGDWNLRTVGAVFIGILKVQVSLDDKQTWGTYREYENGTTGGVNYDRDGIETDSGVYYRLLYSNTSAGGGTAYLKSESAYINGTVTITNFVNSTNVQGYVVTELGSTDAVKTWSEGAFSEERGYPRTVEFYENRLWFGGTDYLVNTIWASRTGIYDDFKTGTLDDSGLRLSINSDNVIEWLLGRNQLFVGTLGDEWILSGGDSQVAITPTTILARRQTSFGSKDGIDALIASDSVMYLQRQGRKLREFEYSFEADAYKSIDATMLSEHITEGGITQISEQQQPEPIVWCIRGDGQLLGMTLSKDENVMAWHRHVTDGQFESVAVIPTEGEDRVYVVVKRDNGRYVEWLRPVDWGDDDKDAWFVDSGLDFDGGDPIDFTAVSVLANSNVVVTLHNTWTNGINVRFQDVSGMTQLENYIFTVTNSTTTNITLMIASTGDFADGSSWNTWTGTGTVERVQNTFTNVLHLAGEELSIFADGGVIPNETVTTNGILTTDEYYNRVIAGLPYTARLSPMYIDIVNNNMISYGKTKNPYMVHFRVKDSGTFNYGSTTNALYPVSVREPSLTAGSPVPFYSGDLTTMPINTKASTAPEFWVTSDECLPLEILSLTIFTDVKEYRQ